jgi:hypothetical protein
MVYVVCTMLCSTNIEIVTSDESVCSDPISLAECSKKERSKRTLPPLKEHWRR